MLNEPKVISGKIKGTNEEKTYINFPYMRDAV